MAKATKHTYALQSQGLLRRSALSLSKLGNFGCDVHKEFRFCSQPGREPRGRRVNKRGSCSPCRCSGIAQPLEEAASVAMPLEGGGTAGHGGGIR